MTAPLYVPLWCKSNGSFLEGASTPEALINAAAAKGLPALAVTDRDGVYGIVRRSSSRETSSGSAIVSESVSCLARTGLAEVAPRKVHLTWASW